MQRKEKIKNLKRKELLKMIKSSELKTILAGTDLDGILAKNYKKEDVASQKERYAALTAKFEEYFGADREVGIYSAPGRT